MSIAKSVSHAAVVSENDDSAAKKAYPIVKSIFILLVLLSALCAALHTVADNDMGWHLATGRYVVQYHQIPRTDVLSFTTSGKPWTYPPFAGVLLYLTYCAFGYAGLSWFCALACLAVVAYLVRKGDVGSTVLAMLAVQSIAARTTPRADLFSTVFFAFFLGELWAYHRGVRSRPWLLPVVMLFWVNLHPGFIAGLGAIAAYVLTEVLDLSFAGRRQAVLERLKKVWPWLAACGVATLVNPWGPRIYLASATFAGLVPSGQAAVSGSSSIDELQGVPISPHMLYQLIDVRHMENGLTWLFLLGVILVGLFLWKRQAGGAVIALVALYSGLAHARYIGLFVITIATLGGPLLSEIFVRSSTWDPKSSRSLARVPEALATLVLIGFCGVTLLHIADFISDHTYVVFNTDWRFGAGESSWFPARAAAFIRREQLPGNILEDYTLGGYEAWSLGPQYPDFIDGRGVSPDIGVEQDKLYSENPDSPLWQSEAERRNLNILLFATSGFRALQKINPMAFCQSTTWRPVYVDDVSMVFLHNTPQNRPWIDRLQIDCRTLQLTPPASASRSALYDFYLNSGALFFKLERDREAEASLRHASELFPEDPNAHSLLASLRWRQQRYREAEQEYQTSLALMHNNAVLYALGLLYVAEGRNDEGVEAIERAAKESVLPMGMYMTLGNLEVSLNHPEQALEAFDGVEKHSPYRGGGESLAPEFYAQIAEGRSEAHRLLGHWSEAISFQQAATQLTPLVANRWNRLAALYKATGQMQLAAEAQQRAAALPVPDAPH